MPAAGVPVMTGPMSGCHDLLRLSCWFCSHALQRRMPAQIKQMPHACRGVQQGGSGRHQALHPAGAGHLGAGGLTGLAAAEQVLQRLRG